MEQTSVTLSFKGKPSYTQMNILNILQSLTILCGGQWANIVDILVKVILGIKLKLLKNEIYRVLD